MIRSISLAAVIAIVGCGVSRPSFPTPATPTGTVKFSDGTPLAHVQLYFVPTNALAPAFGTVGATGSFTLTTVNGQDGICPGKYVVYVRPLPTATGADAGKGRATLAKVPEKFKDDGSKSPLEVDVASGTAALDLTVNLR